MRQFWKNEEIEFVKIKYKSISIYDIAQKLNRSERAIRHAITKLDLNERKKYNQPIDRFILKIAISKEEFNDSPCWIWISSVNNKGYGIFKSLQKRYLAHVWAYNYFVGQVSHGLELDHLCRNTRCTNPMHLESVTHRENVLRGIGPSAIQARQTHCKNGHIFDNVNTYIDKTNARHCRKCDNGRKKYIRNIKRNIK